MSAHALSKAWLRTFKASGPYEPLPGRGEGDVMTTVLMFVGKSLPSPVGHQVARENTGVPLLLATPCFANLPLRIHKFHIGKRALSYRRGQINWPKVST